MTTHLIDSKREKERQAAVAERWATEGTGLPAWDKRTYSAALDPSLRSVTRIGRPWWQHRHRRAAHRPVEKRVGERVMLIWVEVGPSGRWVWHLKPLGMLGASAAYDSPAALLRGMAA